MQHVFSNLKRSSGITIDLDSPSPAKRSRPVGCFGPSVPNPGRLSGLPANEAEDEEEPIPRIEEALEALMCEGDAEVMEISSVTAL